MLAEEGGDVEHLLLGERFTQEDPGTEGSSSSLSPAGLRGEHRRVGREIGLNHMTKYECSFRVKARVVSVNVLRAAGNVLLATCGVSMEDSLLRGK